MADIESMATEPAELNNESASAGLPDQDVEDEMEHQSADSSSLISDADDDDPADKSERDITKEKDGGVLKTIIREGKGWEKPSKGDKVEVHYVGRLTDGTIFDSSRERGQNFAFKIGAGEVIKGWDVAIQSMKRNEVAKFVLKPEYAYGETGSPPKIAPNSTLEFEIELFDWKMDDVTPKKNGGVCKRILVDGEGYQSPTEGSLVEIHIAGKTADLSRVFEERDVSFNLGEGSEVGICEGIELALAKMKKGEKAEVHIKPQYLWGVGVDKPEFGLKAGEYEKVIYEVELKSFEKMKESWELSDTERIEQSELAKNKGTEYFKQNKFALALKMYRRIVNNLGSPEDIEGDDELKAKRKQLLLAGHLNSSLCYLKLKEPLDAIKSANSALELDANNEKALFRRGSGYLMQKDYELARDDFQKLIDMDPNNKAAKQQLLATQQAMKAYLEREKKMYRNMFERLYNSSGI